MATAVRPGTVEMLFWTPSPVLMLRTAPVPVSTVPITPPLVANQTLPSQSGVRPTMLSPAGTAFPSGVDCSIWRVHPEPARRWPTRTRLLFPSTTTSRSALSR